jgi:uncharacterized protein YcbK (DUF882 family)
MSNNNKQHRKRLSLHFFEDEFKCKCGLCQFDEWIDSVFIDKLESIRIDVDFPLIITSGARCATHNANVGGVLNSAHVVDKDWTAKAADIQTSHLDGVEKYALLKAAFKYNMRGIGIADSFFHFDNKKRRALWTY